MAQRKRDEPRQLSNDEKQRYPDEQDPVAVADDMMRKPGNRTVSPSRSAVEGAPGANTSIESLDGQMGPDEISEPDEVIKNNEAKLHH
jgi:hypothetical protein